MNANETFKIVVIYDNVAAARRARRMAATLAQQKFKCDLWPIDMLEIQGLRDYTASMAAQANMMIFATGSREDLPEDLKGWIQDWLPNRNLLRAVLVALLDDEQNIWNEPPALCTFLSKIAEQRNLEFLCNLGPWWGKEDFETHCPDADREPLWLRDASPEFRSVRGWDD